MRPPRRYTLPLVGAVLVVFVLLGLVITNQPAEAAGAAPQTSTGPGVSNDACLACHGAPGQTFTMPNGDIVDITIDPDDYTASVHGEGGYACVQCHTDIREYPHPAFSPQTARALTIQLNETCKQCHASFYEKQANSVHAQARTAGQSAAAICSDCHGSHTVQRWSDPQTGRLLPAARLRIPETCAKCHSAIYEKYRMSVHGAALTDEHNLDVPTCINCHGVHNIQDPRTAEFRTQSPLMCAKCHTDKEKMGRYGLSTYVLTSYVADFHGTTVTLFEEQSPDAETNKAVCYDCHGIHDIQRTQDPATGVQLQQNLLLRCQECHPDATANFPTAWLSHYEPSPEKFPIVYYVNLFYKFFIPGTLGGMGVLVALDLGRKVYDRTRKRKGPAAAVVSHPASKPVTEVPKTIKQPAEPLLTVPVLIEHPEGTPQTAPAPKDQPEEPPQTAPGLAENDEEAENE